MSDSLAGAEDDDLETEYVNIVKRGFDSSYNMFQTVTWARLEAGGQHSWIETAAVLSRIVYPASPISKLIEMLDLVWNPSESRWQVPDEPGLVTEIQGHQIQLNLSMLSDMLKRRQWQKVRWEREVPTAAKDERSPGCQWKQKFQVVALAAARDNKNNISADVFIETIQDFCETTTSLYKELARYYKRFKDLVPVTDVKILFSGPESSAQSIHVDCAKFGVILSVPVAFTVSSTGRQKPKTVEVFPKVASTDMRVFPENGHLRYRIESLEFSVTPWYDLPRQQDWPDVVESGSLLFMLSTLPHGGPARVNPSISSALASAKCTNDSYMRFTLFQMWVPRAEKENAVKDLVTVDGGEAQVNNWNHLEGTIANWRNNLRNNGFQVVYNAALEHGCEFEDTTQTNEKQRSKKRKRISQMM